MSGEGGMSSDEFLRGVFKTARGPCYLGYAIMLPPNVFDDQVIR
jgi:hypothetical protein